jgi:hypothetical protein|tara:strand:+ start:3814 stop:4257 length:444 start_codon:yes stop_codon:yes gene_type:complete
MTWYPNSEGRFGASGAKGDAGEKLVEEYCEENGLVFVDKNDYTSQVIKKIDCLVDGVTVDVKTNIFKDYLAVEIFLDNKKKQGPGWLYTTTAEQIYAVDLDNKKIYSYNVEDMQDYAEANKSRAKRTKFNDLVLWVHKSQSFIKELQ